MRKLKIDHQNLETENRYAVATKSWQLTNIETAAMLALIETFFLVSHSSNFSIHFST